MFAESVITKSVCRVATFTRNPCFRGSGSDFRWFWLAIIIIGRSQYDKIISGAEIWSINKYWLENMLFNIIGI